MATNVEITRVDKSQEAAYLDDVQNKGFEHLGEPLQIEFNKDINEIRIFVQTQAMQLGATTVTEVENPPSQAGAPSMLVYYLWRSPQAQIEPQPFACPYCTRPFMALPGIQTQVVACPTCGGANIIPAVEPSVIPPPAAPPAAPPAVQPEPTPAPAAIIEEPAAPAAPPEPPAPAPTTEEPTAPTAPPAAPPESTPEPPAPAIPSQPAPAAPAATTEAPTAPAAPPAAPTTPEPVAAPATTYTPSAPASPAVPSQPAPAVPTPAAPPATNTAPATTAPAATATPNTQLAQAQPAATQASTYDPYSDDYRAQMPSFDDFSQKVETAEKKPQAPLIPPEYENSYSQQFTSTEQAIKSNMQKLANLLANPKNDLKFYDSGELMYPKVTIRKSAYTHLDTRDMDLILIKDGVNDYKIISNESHGQAGGNLMPMQDELFAVKTLGHASYRTMEDWAYLDDSQKEAISKCIYAFTEIYIKKSPKEGEIED